MLDANILKKDRTDIIKPYEVIDDELSQVHTEEYMSSLKVSPCKYAIAMFDKNLKNKFKI